MHPVDCPNWEYNDHPHKTPILQKEIKSVLFELRNGNLDSLTSVSDARPVHLRLFHRLAPEDCPYYAGNYRGENYRCLKYFQVGIPSDRRVGFPPHLVKGYMDELANIVRDTVAALDEGMKLPNNQIPLEEKILYIVAAVCRIFEFFLRIHPYVNGNGHIGRFCMWALLGGRYGLWPVSWPIDPRPADPPYTNLIVDYRNGNPVPLETFIMQTLIAK